jgi:hypothetical protein
MTELTDTGKGIAVTLRRRLPREGAPAGFGDQDDGRTRWK